LNKTELKVQISWGQKELLALKETATFELISKKKERKDDSHTKLVTKNGSILQAKAATKMHVTRSKPSRRLNACAMPST
jgi:hypothetical protein